MPTQLTSTDFKESLNSHVAARGEEIFAQYGPRIGWREMQPILQNRACVRYPCEIVFDSAPLLAGELAHPIAKGEHPKDGFIMYVHPVFMTRLQDVPLLVFYQLVLVNYGEFASADDAETFGAAALGLSREDYYRELCDLAELVGVSSEGCPANE